MKEVKVMWGDCAYQGIKLHREIFKKGIEIEVVKRPAGRYRVYDENWKAHFISIDRLFTVLPKRWLVERTFAWLGRNRRLSKDYEFHPKTTENYLYLSMGVLTTRRMAIFNLIV